MFLKPSICWLLLAVVPNNASIAALHWAWSGNPWRREAGDCDLGPKSYSTWKRPVPEGANVLLRNSRGDLGQGRRPHILNAEVGREINKNGDDKTQSRCLGVPTAGRITGSHSYWACCGFIAHLPRRKLPKLLNALPVTWCSLPIPPKTSNHSEREGRKTTQHQTTSSDSRGDETFPLRHC